ncbi:MAG TPA: hypothetical protein VK638_54275 [Edaphobacter sp.]|nr:hypothetical protein [Edaphobacter sp.]
MKNNHRATKDGASRSAPEALGADAGPTSGLPSYMDKQMGLTARHRVLRASPSTKALIRPLQA